MKNKLGLFYIIFFFSSLAFGSEYYFPKAKLTYEFFEHKKTYYSNDVTKSVDEYAPPTIKFYKYSSRGRELTLVKQPEYKNQTSFTAMNLPKTKNDKTIQLQDIKALKSSSISSSDAFFIEVSDEYSNKSKTNIDTLVLTFQSDDDLEVIKLFESEVDSGLFKGYIQPNSYAHKQNDGYMYIRAGKSIVVKLDDRLTINLSVSSRLRSLATLDNTKQIWLQNQTKESVVQSGEFIKYSIAMQNKFALAVNSIVKIELDKSQNIDMSSIKLDDIPVSKNSLSRSKNNIFINIKILEDSTKKLSYVTKINKLASQTIRQTIMLLDTSMDITTTVKDDFLNPKSIIIGRVGFGSMGMKKVKIYLDNGTSTMTDKNGKYHFEGITPDFHVVKVDTSTIDKRFEIASCKQNTRFAGSKISQFVDTSTVSIQRADFCVKLRDKNSTKLFKDDYNFRVKKLSTKKMPKYTVKSFENNDSKILWPPNNHVPSFPAIKMAFTHKKNQKYKVFINDKAIDMLSYDGFITSQDKLQKIEKFRGIGVESGDNKLKIKIFENDKLVKVLSSNIHFSYSPSRAVVDKKLSYLVADGKHSPIIAVRLFDKDGFIAREGMIGKCRVSDPYLLDIDSDKVAQSPLSLTNKGRYTIDGDGVAYIKLAPTTSSGVAKINFDFQDKTTYTTTWLKAKQDEWMIVGFAKGSMGYKKIKQNMTSGYGEKEVYKDSKVSLYTKGKIPGDILLTLAYDSAKKTDLTILENTKLKKNYNVYADSSKQFNEAPTSKKLYIKLEKDNFYAMFGDFKTGLKQTKLAAYDKKITGLKSEYRGKKFSYVAFATDSKYISHSDEIKPDGTSGKYYLKHQNIIENSENIYIQTRDIDDEDILLKEVLLSRDFDYNFDYGEGYIYFKEPRFATDEKLNPQYIVVDYDTPTEDNKYLTYGGRASYKITKDSEVGSTYGKINNGLAQSELQGIDVMLKLYDNITLKGEVATTDSSYKDKSYAKRVEVEYRGKKADIKAYIHESDKDFGIQGQQNLKDLNQRRVGIKSNYTFNNQNRLLLDTYYKQKLDSEDIQKNYLARYSRRGDGYTVQVGYRLTTDNKIEDDQIQALISKSLFKNRLMIKVKKNHSLKQSILNPDETQIGVDYKITQNIKLFAVQRWSELKGLKKEDAKFGISSTPWKGARISTSIGEVENSDAQSTFANLGIIQDVQVSKNLFVSAGYQKQKTIKSTGEKNSDHNTYSSSMRYKHKKWHYSISGEYKDAKVKKQNLKTSVYTDINSDMAVAFGIRENKIISVDDKKIERVLNSAIAYRPKKSNLTIIDRVDIKHKTSQETNSIKVVNNLYTDYQASKDLSVDMQFGLKYVQNMIDDKKYDDLISLVSLGVIYDITEKIDITSQVSMTFSLEDESYNYSAGSSLGYNLFQNSLVAIGYNIEGFEDNDFVSDFYRAQGPYINFMMKFDEFSLKEKAKRAIQ